MTTTGARTSRTEQHRADPTKAGGVHYTPPELAQFMARNGLALIADAPRVRVLDPACGDGALLAAIADAAPANCAVELVGCDLDPSALTAATRRLCSIPNGRVTWTLECCDFLVEAARARQSQDALLDETSIEALHDPFDLVIANPPYVRTQTLGADAARRLGEAFGLAGRVDLYHAFAVAMAEALAPGGVLTLLCSNRFLTTRTGTSLRQYFTSELDVEVVYDLGDTKLFEAAVLPAVVIARRGSIGRHSARMMSIYEAPSDPAATSALGVVDAIERRLTGPVVIGSQTYEIRAGHLRLSDHSRDPWVLAAEEDGWVSRVDSAAAMRFADVGKVRVGIKTTADPVFIKSSWDSLGDEKPEDDVLRPLLTHHVAERWRVGEASRAVVYPYDLSKEQRVPLDLQSLPRTRRYLEAHRERLEGRKYVVEGGRLWWEIWVPQRPSLWKATKLVFPDISDQPRFFLDRSGAVVNGDCYWISLARESEHLGLVMLAVANSTFGTKYYDRVCGNKLYSGRRRYITQYVERFPLPDPSTPEARKIIELVGSLVDGKVARDDQAKLESEIDELVWRSFGIEEIPR
jgi:adenine-specific DNA-methyltransferase